MPHEAVNALKELAERYGVETTYTPGKTYVENGKWLKTPDQLSLGDTLFTVEHMLKEQAFHLKSGLIAPMVVGDKWLLKVMEEIMPVRALLPKGAILERIQDQDNAVGWYVDGKYDAQYSLAKNEMLLTEFSGPVKYAIPQAQLHRMPAVFAKGPAEKLWGEMFHEWVKGIPNPDGLRFEVQRRFMDPGEVQSMLWGDKPKRLNIVKFGSQLQMSFTTMSHTTTDPKQMDGPLENLSAWADIPGREYMEMMPTIADVQKELLRLNPPATEPEVVEELDLLSMD